MAGRVPALNAVVAPRSVHGVTLDRVTLSAPAVFAVATLFVSRLAINARTPVPFDLVAVQDLLVPVTALACAGSLIAIAVLDAGGYETVGLAFVGVFGVTGTIARPASVPAVVALVAGSGVAAGARLYAERTFPIGPAVVTGVLLGGLTASLGSSLGIAAATTRSLGTQLTLLGVAGTPIFLVRGRTDYLAGAVAAGLLVALGIVAPFLLGATGLVAGGIVGASLPLMALSVGGLTVTASAALRTRQHAATLGAGLLLFAGVPATLPRAVAVVLALVLLVETATGGARDA
ncbi:MULTISPECIES: hypothetical protein [unclassified Halorhabdus]|uniref:hypothetical protein n=1 Tax=unclassified Halorhabdus TaxID=2621901 RepID=UPI00131E04C4|nr:MULTISPECIES: hypothetical protein [unclassified Halorhabdus]